MQDYRVFVINSDGHVIDRFEIWCLDDDEAKEKARQLLDGQDIERPPGLQLSPRGQLRLTAMQSRRLRSPINVIHLKMQNRQELAGELGSCKQRLFIDLRSRKRLSS